MRLRNSGRGITTRPRSIGITWANMPKTQVNISFSADMEAIVKELKENFSRKDTENLDKINSLKRDLS